MNTKLITAISIALTLGACASVPQSYPALENARSAVRAAEADPNVATYAALDLNSARQDLDAAEAAAAAHNAAGIDQPAYLATQLARLAQLKASVKATNARIAAGKADRDQIELNARNREINSAVTARDSAVVARDQATQKAAAVQAELDALKAKETDRGMVLTLGDVLFDTGRAQLNPGAARNLDQLVQFLTAHPERHVEIDGYTDSVGSDSFNLDLSERRAAAVKMVLVDRGIDSSRIVSRGYGSEYSVASNAEPSGRQLNRRVEIVIGGNDGAPVVARGR